MEVRTLTRNALIVITGLFVWLARTQAAPNQGRATIMTTLPVHLRPSTLVPRSTESPHPTNWMMTTLPYGIQLSTSASLSSNEPLIGFYWWIAVGLAAVVVLMFLVALCAICCARIQKNESDKKPGPSGRYAEPDETQREREPEDKDGDNNAAVSEEDKNY